MSGLYWLASYPKSGNTWVRCFLAALLGGGEMQQFGEIVEVAHASAARNLLEQILDVPTSDFTSRDFMFARADLHRAQAATRTASRFLKVHDRYDLALFQQEATSGIVYIVRDPRDVAPSLAAHLGKSLDQTIEMMSDLDFRVGSQPGAYYPQGPQLLSSWTAHVTSWLDQDRSSVLLLRYEDLSADPALQFRRLVDFIGVTADAPTFDRALETTRFEVLRAKEDSLGFPSAHSTWSASSGKASLVPGSGP